MEGKIRELRMEHITKRFPGVLASDDISIEVGEGEVLALVGENGAGKTTLMNILMGLYQPDEGRILYEGRDVSGLSAKEMQRLRSRSVGFVFQSSLLLEDFTVLENAAMPLLIQGKKPREAYSEAERLLDKVGLLDRRDYRPRLLSGGERQRAAIARALAPSPLVIFADEPTGSLDERTAASIEALMLDTVRSEGRCMLTVTHNRDFAAKADRMLTLSEGRLLDGNV